MFCLQLANRLTNGELAEFFNTNDCRVRNAKIVTDRNSGRSKGVRRSNELTGGPVCSCKGGGGVQIARSSCVCARASLDAVRVRRV